MKGNDNYITFKYYVDLIICDITISHFKKTNYQTYGNYAAYIRNMLINMDSDQSNLTNLLNSFSKELNEIFAFNFEESINYIIDFFMEEKYFKYYKIVYEIRDIFGYFVVD